MIRIENIVLGMCATNCYAVFDGGVKTPAGYMEDGSIKDAVIVDPAADVYRIKDMINRYRLKPAAVLLTHGHFDHLLAAEQLRGEYGIKVYANREERCIMTDAGNNLSVAFTGEGMTFDADEYFDAGDVLELAGYVIRTIGVPGHTIGGTCYYFEREKVLLSGDTLLAGSVGRSDFPTGSASVLLRGIREKLLSLPSDVRIYPGHGEATTVGYEKEHNPFLV